MKFDTPATANPIDQLKVSQPGSSRARLKRQGPRRMPTNKMLPHLTPHTAMCWEQQSQRAA